MPEIYRALIYILAVSLPVLYVAQLALRSFVDPAELRIWRNCWFLGTFALFVSGSVLAYGLLILALSIYAHKSLSAPYNLFLVLLFTAPAIGVNVAIPGLIGSLIDLSPARIFALAFLLPSAFLLFRKPRPPNRVMADTLFGVFILLLVVLSGRHGSLTYELRAVAVIALDMVLPYYVFSRALASIADVRRTLAAFIFGALPFAATGAFEFVRGWRLYNTVIEQLGMELVQPYLFRDGMLRASVTAIEPIAFGFVCMVAIGFLLANKNLIRDRFLFPATLCIAGAGLAAGLSRGPWLGAAVLLLIVAAASRRGVLNIVKASVAVGLICVPLLFTSAGERIVRLLPFVGSVDKDNEEYRTRLVDVSMNIVARNPLFGSAQYRDAPELAEIIQGQGIVDIVNTYVAIALEYGLVGLAAFLAIFLNIGLRLVGASLRSDGEYANLIRALAGTLVAIILTIGTVSSVSVIPYIYWALAGLCVAALRASHTVVVEAPDRPEPTMTVLGQPPLFGRVRG